MKEVTKTDIGERLWEYMKQNPLSSVDTAKKIGICRNTLLTIARGACEPRTKVRCMIERFLQQEEDKKNQQDLVAPKADV